MPPMYREMVRVMEVSEKPTNKFMAIGMSVKFLSQVGMSALKGHIRCENMTKIVSDNNPADHVLRSMVLGILRREMAL